MQPLGTLTYGNSVSGINDATQKRKTNPVPDVGTRIEHVRCRDAREIKKKKEKEKQMQIDHGQNRIPILKSEERGICHTHSALPKVSNPESC